LAHHVRTASLLALERYEDALASATRTIELAPQQAEAYYFRALARRALDDVAGALADAAHSLKLLPDDERVVELQSELADGRP
jgi:regulator of sirC expression with transglutaminase-like and TPR domain